MTDQKKFKSNVRRRMARTGEAYTAARRNLLPNDASARDAATSDATRAAATRDRESTHGARALTPDELSRIPGLLPGCTRFGGVQGDSAVLTNALRQAGVRSPHDGQPLSEAMVSGLCGGIGFMYFVFEYEGCGPTMTITARHASMPDAFAEGLFARAGAAVTMKTSGAPGPAAKALDDALARGRIAVCTVDPVRLPYLALPEMWAGAGAQLVGVVGRHGDTVLLDDGCVRPNEVAADAFATARASYRKAKQRLLTVDAALPEHDLARGIRAALAATSRGFHEAPFKGYASNFGFAGMEKWRALLTDGKDAKGWRKVFAPPERAFLALTRTYECLRHALTAPAAGRPLYADFLDEAAAITGDDTLRDASTLFRRSAALWDEIATLALADDEPTLRRAREILDAIADTLRDEGSRGAVRIAALRAEFAELPRAASLGEDDVFSVYDAMAERVDALLPLERDAVALLA